MEWARAKNIIIVLLVILNVILGALIFYYDHEAPLTNEEKQQIIEILKNEKINYNIDFIKEKKFAERILVRHHDFDPNSIVNVFFDDTANLTRSRENEMLTFNYNNDKEVLYVEKNGFTYRNYIDSGEGDVEQEIAEKLCSEVMDKLNAQFSEFKNFTNKYIAKDRETLVIYYKENFRGFTLNSNYVRFLVNDVGITEVSCEYFMPVGFEKDSRKEIYSSVEALFRYRRYKYTLGLSNDNNNPEVTIEAISLVYNIDRDSIDEQNIFFNPYYILYLKNEDDPTSFLEPILINAFDNTILE